jgi:kynurenine formamidase
MLSSRIGTHIDAPSHFIGDVGTVDELPLDALLGEAQVMRLAGVGTPIRPEDIGPITCERVLIHTGWSDGDHGAESHFNAHPLQPHRSRIERSVNFGRNVVS